jgi:ABC-type polysaccharide transport system permease subunit
MMLLITTCYYGEQLKASQLRVADEAYNCAWYDGSKKFKQMILITIMSAQKPRMLTGLKFVEIEMPLLSWVGN